MCFFLKRGKVAELQRVKVFNVEAHSSASFFYLNNYRFHDETWINMFVLRQVCHFDEGEIALVILQRLADFDCGVSGAISPSSK